MVGNQGRWREVVFVGCPLRVLVPEVHVLRGVDRALELSWLREEVAVSFCSALGRPSIEP